MDLPAHVGNSKSKSSRYFLSIPYAQDQIIRAYLSYAPLIDLWGDANVDVDHSKMCSHDGEASVLVHKARLQLTTTPSQRSWNIWTEARS